MKGNSVWKNSRKFESWWVLTIYIFSCLKRFESHYQFFHLKSRLFNFCKSFIPDFENFHDPLHLNEWEDDLVRKKILRIIFQFKYVTYSSYKTFWLTLTLPAPYISESCTEMKINVNFCFHTSLWCLKRFYEGLKGLLKTFSGSTKKCKNKNLRYIFSLLPELRWKGLITPCNKEFF